MSSSRIELKIPCSLFYNFRNALKTLRISGNASYFERLSYEITSGSHKKLLIDFLQTLVKCQLLILVFLRLISTFLQHISKLLFSLIRQIAVVVYFILKISAKLSTLLLEDF